MTSKETYPNIAYTLTLIGGILVILGGIIVSTLGVLVTLFLFGFGGILGVLGIVWGIILIFGASKLKSNPEQHVMWGVFIIFFSVLSWLGGLGGFFIGFLLSLLGGILALVWNPVQTTAQVTPQVTQSSTRFCPNCGATVSQDTKFCPRCGRQLP